MIVHMKGKASHKIIEMGLEMLENMNHRGACGCEENSGDGAGVSETSLTATRPPKRRPTPSSWRAWGAAFWPLSLTDNSGCCG